MNAIETELAKPVVPDSIIYLGPYMLSTSSRVNLASLFERVAEGEISYVATMPWTPGTIETYEQLLDRLCKYAGIGVVRFEETLRIKDIYDLTTVREFSMPDMQHMMDLGGQVIWDFFATEPHVFDYVVLPNKQLGRIIGKDETRVRAMELSTEQIEKLRRGRP